METTFLSGKTVVITGGAGVLCSAMARDLAAYGAKIAILDLNAERAQQVAGEIRATGAIAEGIGCNVLEPASLKSAKEQVHTLFGPCDILLNGAGGNHPKACTTKEIFEAGDLEDDSIVSFFDLTKEGFGFVFDLNIVGTILTTQVFAQDMLKSGGKIINFSSMSAPSPMTKVPAYSAAKAGISNLTQWLAVHFAGTKIRVNAIAPGFFLTEQNRTLLTNPDGSLTERSHKILTHTPMRRFGDPSDLLGPVRFLLDDSMSEFITGITLPIDGGFMAYSGV